MMLGSAGPDLCVAPALLLEPLLSYYLRRASAYAYIRHALQECFGVDALSLVRLLCPERTVELNLWQQLAFMEDFRLSEDGSETSIEGTRVEIGVSLYQSAYPFVAELSNDSDKVMIRSDFRAFCDRFSSDREIIRELSGGV